MADSARIRARERRLEYRCGLLLCAIAVMQIAVLPVLAHIIPIQGPILEIGSVVYGGVGLLLGLFAVDVFLDFYSALREAAAAPPR